MRLTEYFDFIIRTDIGMGSNPKPYDYHHFSPWTMNERKGTCKMKLSDIKIECTKCRVWFTPSDDRAKSMMESKGYIDICRECEQDV
jgi:nicotinamide mononucleotide adenylyltransferase